MNPRKSPLLPLLHLALLLAGLALFVGLFPRYDDLSALQVRISQSDALQKAGAVATGLGVNVADITPEVHMDRLGSLLRHHQAQRGLRQTARRINQDIPGYYWRIDYEFEPAADSTKNNGGTPSLRVDVAMTGQILRIDNEFQARDPSPGGGLGQNRSAALAVLHRYTDGDSTAWTFHKEDFEISRNDSLYRFEWLNQSTTWTDSLIAEIALRRGHLRSFSMTSRHPDHEDVLSETTVVGIIIGIVFFVLAIIVVYQLVKRLRQDKIDFRLSWIIALITLILFSGMIAVSMLGQSWWAIALGAVLGGLFVALGVFVLVGVSESLARDVWNDKLFTLDRLVQGRFRSFAVGQSLLQGLGMAGFFFILNLLAYVIGDAVGGVWINRSSDDVSYLFSAFSSAHILGSFWTGLIFFIFAFIVFAFSFLRRIVASSFLFVVLSGLIVAAIPVSLIDLAPMPSAPLVHLIMGCLMAWCVLRGDMLAAITALVAFSSLQAATPLFAQGTGTEIFNGLLVALFPLGFAITGVVAVVAPVAEDKETEYIPPYLKRISERERFQRELEIARTVQLNFLPNYKLESEWLDVASVCLPAYEVGGDYYDFLQLDANRLGIVVGDVSGKGVSAAFFMTLLKGILVSQSRLMQSPREVLIQMNDLFYENAQRGVFISVVYGVFNRERGVLTYARAGHNPVIVHSGQSEKGTQELYPKGIALGLDKGDVFASALEEVEVKVHTGDVFVFYTDGFSEAMDANKSEFGEDRLAEAIQKSTQSPAEGILKNIQDAVKEFTGDTQQHDDMTMVVVRVGA